MKKGAENEEILMDDDGSDDIEIESEEDAQGRVQGKLKQLRTDIKKLRKERDENLAGWQRAKADLANFRRTVDEEREKYKARAKGSFIESLLPVLDTFDAAMQDSSWNAVDESWRNGVERIAQQLHQALQNEGLVSFGKEGDVFDPTIHECMSMKDSTDKKKDGTIATVLQQGYMVQNELVRPAKVVVAHIKD